MFCSLISCVSLEKKSIVLAENVDFYSKLLQILCFSNDTGKHSFCHTETNLCLCIFPRWIQIGYWNCSITHSFCVTEFWKCSIANFVLSCYQYVLNMADVLHYILKIEWAWKLNHSKDNRHVSPITDSWTMQAQTCSNMLGHETNLVSSAWGTLHCWWCATLHCDKCLIVFVM